MSKQDGLDIGDRMKTYEDVTHISLPKRIPVILRIDGRAFHTITRRRFKKSWSMEFCEQMIETATTVMKDIQGCSFCYSQSDEISFLITDYKTINTGNWFGYDVRKMISISASLASAVFSRLYGKNVCFDSRCFSVPKDDVCNYFIWRQIDATRNAIQMLGREHFSHKSLHKLSCNDIQEKLFQEKGINFNDCKAIRKRGFCIIDNDIDFEIPVFIQDREYIEKFVYIRED
jgi:tRNA(His) 5'-end guanylyltransferase